MGMGALAGALVVARTRLVKRSDNTCSVFCNAEDNATHYANHSSYDTIPIRARICMFTQLRVYFRTSH